MIRAVRRVLVLMGGVLGITVATTTHAAAGLVLNNHTEPVSRPAREHH